MSDLDKLRELLVGSVIEAIDPPDGGVSEAICKVTVRKGEKTEYFHLHATDLGWWVGEHQSLRDDGNGNLAPCWENFDDMIESMTDHLRSDAMDDFNHMESPFESRDDSLTRCVGFRCKHTGEAWWVSLTATKRFNAERIPDIVTTTTGRRQVAAFLGIHHRLPHSAEELAA